MQKLTLTNKFKNALDLILISFLALYFEILFIRWIPSSIQILAFFTNVVLLASFLGLGIGCLLSDAKFRFINILSFLILNVVLTVFVFKHLDVSAGLLRGEVLRGFYSAKGVNFLLIIAVLFCFISLFFIPLGQQLGISLKTFPPLTAYSLNIVGSILGIAEFSYLSHLMIRPFYWFALGLFFSLWFTANTKKKFLLNIGVCFWVLFIVSHMDPTSFWSPYQKVDITPHYSSSREKPQDFSISINNTHLQFAFNLSDDRSLNDPYLNHYKQIYEFPYAFLRPKKVLVLGAGSGNDVSAAIRRGAEEIDAVEIDPFVAQLGEDLHPEKPYLSPKVRIFVDDARSFIRKSNKKYGLITFGYLDAHRVFSQFSSVRLDNFIYTKESFLDVKKHLAPGGCVVLTYLGFRHWIEDRLFFGLKEVFGQDVLAFRTSTYDPDDTVILVAGDGVRNLPISESKYFKFDKSFQGPGGFISDDWPYLYLQDRGIPLHYVVILLFVLVFSGLAIQGTNKLDWKRFNAHFFFLGAGFLLLETVSITRFAILFGSTWVVNSVVFVSIMAMILLANAVLANVQRINIGAVYALLFGSILLNYFIGPGMYLSFNHALAVVFSSIVMSLPLFFAGIIFASSLKKTSDITEVFGVNLLGAIVGGLCEYISMWSGFNFLYLVAMGMYLISFLVLQVPKTKLGIAGSDKAHLF